MPMTLIQRSIRGGRRRQAAMSPKQRTELSLTGAKSASSKRCVCGHHASQHRTERARGVDVTDCTFAANQIACLCTEYRPRGDMPSARGLRRMRGESLRVFATEATPAIDRMMRGIDTVLQNMPAEPGARCRIRAHADRPLDPKRKNFCVDCAAKQRAQDMASWRKRHGTVSA